MDLGLKGKYAVVTAASKGLGRAVAVALAEEGANLLICSRDAAGIEALAAELSDKYGVTAAGMSVDVGNAEQIAGLIAKAKELFPRVDALLCSAGGPPSGSFLSFDDDAWEKAFQTNMMSVVRLVRGFYPLMAEQGGRMVTIASTSVKVPIPGLVLSNTLRAGIAGLMKTLSIELAGDRILLNTICPGRVMTDRLTELDEARAGRENKSVEDIRAAIVKDIPLGRYGKPEEFAALASYLLSPLNSYMTGSTFFVDGGMVKSL
ncbi:SDR family oxidoreductase [Paenibacillus sp. MBLB4367]|uniref:SDR family oxidoreductase n=1 Tax=Paenibacillus sp. MBLB4367 TaxID=3384767 RepID=UPI0039083E10